MKYSENLFARRDPRAVRDASGALVPPTPSQPAQPGARPAPGAAPAPAPASPAPEAASAARAEEPGGSKLIVGPNIKLKGVEIDDCDTLVVEGRVEATMVSRAIQISETGAFSGKVDVEVAEVRGDFRGEMTARRKLVIHASGRVSGKIRYGKMLVQEGGVMNGDIGAIDSPEGASAPVERPPALAIR
ncbi:MAG TPA: polymer-forming cytoskeletal protein [Usitatibacter sp.]|jgi:cytoskeletal protein CcmA (bactofilin family)|nr:polymer-forming cytoskeletal protein [Usitatibacter sp.]